MSTTTQENKSSVVDGLDEDHTVNLNGDLPELQPVVDPEKPEETPVSTESWKVTDQSPKSVKDCCVMGAGGGPRRPAISRVIDNEGHAKVTIILGANERYNHLATVLSLIDSASENDVVDITLVGDIGCGDGTIEQRSLLSAIERCPAHVITRAGMLASVGDVAIWLSGDEPRMSPIGAIFLRQPQSGFWGDTADYESQLSDYLASLREFSEFIVGRGLITKEEMDTMYKTRGIIGLFGPALRDRISKLQAIK